MPHSTGPNLVLVRSGGPNPLATKGGKTLPNREIPMTKAALDPENRDKLPAGPVAPARQEPGPGFSVDRERFTELR